MTKILRRTKFGILSAIFGQFVWLSQAHACAVCYGAKDSLLTKGLLIGVISLLVILSGVLSCVVIFLMGVRKRSKILPV